MYTFEDLEKLVNEHPEAMDQELMEKLYLPYPDADTIRKAEQVLNVPFPEDYTKSLLRWGVMFLEYTIIYGICENNVNYGGGHNVIALTQDSREYAKLPEYYLAIVDHDGDEVICLDTRNSNGGPVIAWDCFYHDVLRTIADSYLEFVIDLIKTELEYSASESPE